MKKSKLRIITSLAMLIAIGIILAEVIQVSYPPGSATFLRFSLGYITIIIAGILYGPIYGMVAGLIQDVLGFYVATLLSLFLPWVSSPGAFFIGYTVNAVLYGLIAGLMFMKTFKNEDRIFCILSFVISGVMLFASIWFFVNPDQIRASYLTATDKQIIAGISMAVAFILCVMNFIFYKQSVAKRPPFKIVFMLTILYIITSLILTPIWIVYFYMGYFSSVTYVSFWALLPIRIVKMPIDIAIYSAVLPRLLKVSKSVMFAEE
ncbi:MAG: folate family ECF transporter S component [Candidatus Izemoplasmatales bacterium]|jgi:ECF transporter S component (folate family)|nr:folate family ECF transporter S component [Candidatus Izemoplasmatales bacterium]MDD4595757.1 folate family ECF transporter S component [Candidatus Izemoplasmatales bacterium]